MDDSVKEPGWYVDPEHTEPVRVRYWDGVSWHAETRSLDDSQIVRDAVIGKPSNGQTYTPDIIKKIEKTEDYQNVKFKKKRSLGWLLVKLFILADFLSFIVFIVVPIYPDLYALFENQFKHVNDEFIRVGAPIVRGWLQDMGLPVKG